MKDSKTKLKIWTVILLTVGVLLLAAGFVTMYYENTGRARSGAKIPEGVAEEKEPENTAEPEKESPDPEIVQGEMKEGSGEAIEEISEEVEEKVLIPNPYKDYFLENEDMAAWIVVPGTVIDYPVSSDFNVITLGIG